VIVTSILGSMLQNALRARRHLRAERHLRQTELLLRAGADLAAFRLARDPAYSGETWRVASDQVAGTGDAQVTIGVGHESEQPSWQVRVVAEYPAGSDRSIRRSRTFSLPRSTSQIEE
jgi:hypothetical protein